MVTAEKFYETNQTTIAAFLFYSGIEIADISWEHGTGTFHFENTPKAQDLLETFLRGDARVEPQGFNNAYGEVKRRMWAERDGE